MIDWITRCWEAFLKWPWNHNHLTPLPQALAPVEKHWVGYLYTYHRLEYCPIWLNHTHEPKLNLKHFHASGHNKKPCLSGTRVAKVWHISKLRKTKLMFSTLHTGCFSIYDFLSVFTNWEMPADRITLGVTMHLSVWIRYLS